MTNNESFHHFNDNLAGVCCYFKLLLQAFNLKSIKLASKNYDESCQECQVRKRTLRRKQLRSQRFRGWGLTSSCKQYLQVENKTQSFRNNGIKTKQLKLSLRNIFNMPNAQNNETDFIETKTKEYIVRKE